MPMPYGRGQAQESLDIFFFAPTSPKACALAMCGAKRKGKKKVKMLTSDRKKQADLPQI
jgi:hypothetical protein